MVESLRKRIVPDEVLNDFYDQVRCGLFHSGMTRHKVIINNTFDEVIDFTELGAIKINPKKFLTEINLDFDNYIQTLRVSTNQTERDKFSRMFTNLQS